jgi:hypothetical protein
MVRDEGAEAAGALAAGTGFAERGEAGQIEELQPLRGLEATTQVGGRDRGSEVEKRALDGGDRDSVTLDRDPRQLGAGAVDVDPGPHEAIGAPGVNDGHVGKPVRIAIESQEPRGRDVTEQRPRTTGEDSGDPPCVRRVRGVADGVDAEMDGDQESDRHPMLDLGHGEPTLQKLPTPGTPVLPIGQPPDHPLRCVRSTSSCRVDRTHRVRVERRASRVCARV